MTEPVRPLITKDEDASLIIDETQELLDQGITGVAVIGYRGGRRVADERPS